MSTSAFSNSSSEPIEAKVDEKKMIRNQYNRIPYPAQDTKREKEHRQLRRNKVTKRKPKAKRIALCQQMTTTLSEQKVKDEQKADEQC